MTPTQNPELAYIALMAGILLASIEFIRPGLILPGVTGAVLIMLSISVLASRTLRPEALLFILAGIALTLVDAAFHRHATLALAGATLISCGACYLDPSIRPVTAASVSFPTVLICWWLLDIAFQAHASKAIL